jgi:thiamine-phosphate pyrophosphorylase
LRALVDCCLYGILDLNYVAAADMRRVAASMIQGGVDLLQLRGKATSIEQLVDLARDLHEITAPCSVPLIVNDHAEVAREVAVEGVHVGQDDDAIAIARAKAGRTILVGKSTHSLEQARAAETEGADYIGFGPIFATPTKPDYKPIGLADIKQAHADVALPIFCIGGIKIDNLEQVVAAGARRIAIVSGLLKAVDIAQYAQDVKHRLHSSFVIRHSSF